MPTLRQLRYLVAIADQRHFGRAAQAVGISQPTLSQQMRALEDRLGVSLIDRRGSSPELTPIGREIVERSRRVVVEIENIKSVASRAADLGGGILRFGVSPTLGPYLLPEIVAALHRERPDLRLYIREGIPDDQARDLSSGRLDILLGPLPVDGPDIHVEPLFHEPIQLVAATDHPLARQEVVRTADLAGMPLLSLDLRHHFHRKAMEICAEHGMTLLRDYEGTSLDSIRQMAGSGLGLAILPQFYIRSEVGGAAGVRILKIEGWQATRSIGLCWRRSASNADLYAALAATIRQISLGLLANQTAADTE